MATKRFSKLARKEKKIARLKNEMRWKIRMSLSLCVFVKDLNWMTFYLYTCLSFTSSTRSSHPKKKLYSKWPNSHFCIIQINFLFYCYQKLLSRYIGFCGESNFSSHDDEEKYERMGIFLWHFIWHFFSFGDILLISFLS